jgi:thiol:disulfide interchange protein
MVVRLMRGTRIRFAVAALVGFALFAASAARAQEEVVGGLPGAKMPGAGLFDKNQESDKGVVAVTAQFTAPAADKPGRLFVTARIEPGWHIYSITQPTRESGNPTVTKINLKLPDGVGLLKPFKALSRPKTVTEEGYGDLPIEKHEGTITWFAPIELAAGVDPARLKIRGTVSFGACDAKSCRPPEDVPFTAALGPGMDVPESIAGDVAASPKNGGPATPIDLRALAVQMAWAFLGGLILNLMPCVLPVIGLKILAFVQQAGESRGRIFMLNVWYSIGLLSVFMVLAALATGLGAAADKGLGWGQQFTEPSFKVTMTALVFAMALSFLGVWEIPIPGFVGSGRAGDLQNKEGPTGAFCKGVFTTILATPCSGPFLGPVFGYLLGQPPQVAYCIFGAMGLGMASPYLLIGAFPALIRVLPKPGAWMDTFKQLMGFLLLATVVYLFNTLTALYVIPTMTLLLGLWFACWWIGRTPLTQPTARIVAWCGGVAVAALLGYFAFTVLMEAPKLPWKPFSPAAVAQAQSEGKTVMVDFTANWCPNCKANSKWAIETDAVRDLVEANGVVPLLADWTDKSPMIKKALNDLNRNSIPLLVVWPASGGDPIVLSDVVTQGQVLEALKTAGPSRKP